MKSCGDSNQFNGMVLYCLLEELHSVSVLHRSPQVTEAAVVIETLAQDGEQTRKHRADLEDVCPHRRLHAALGNTDKVEVKTETRSCQIASCSSSPFRRN